MRKLLIDVIAFLAAFTLAAAAAAPSCSDCALPEPTLERLPVASATAAGA